MTAIENSLVFAIFPPKSTAHSPRKRRSSTSPRSVIIDGIASRLSRTEFRLLVSLAKTPGKTVTYEQLYQDVFAERPLKSADHLRMYIRLLRRRIEPNPAMPRYLITSRKRGYRLALIPSPAHTNTPTELHFLPTQPQRPSFNA